MTQLSPAERRDLLARFIDDASVNWAHVCVAQLMKEGYVDRILTTNFDPLIIRACAMLGLFPAVYDFAASQLSRPRTFQIKPPCFSTVSVRASCC